MMDYPKTEHPDILLEAMQQHELMIAKLYQAYAERIEDYADFWEELAQAELRHVRCLKHLQSQLEENPDIIIVQRFSLEAINSSIRYINNLIDRTTFPEFEPINAFSLAMKLEEALLEKKYFEVLEGDSNEVKETLKILFNETEQHFQILSQAMNDYKAGK
jgi:hypothetical protein